MRSKIFMATAVLILLTSCNKVKYLADVDLNVDLSYSKQFSVPAVDTNYFPENGLLYSFPVQAFETNSLEVLASHSLTTDKLDRVNLKSFSQKISKSQDFDFVDSVQVFISADGMPEILMAKQNNVPPDSRTINFECVDQDLKLYFLKEKIYLRMQGHFNTAPKAAIYTSNFKFNVVGNLTNEN